jgi:carbon-monoxide dehydrogenase medium subunit
VLPQIRQGRLKAERLVDISRIKDLDFIAGENGVLRIGALATFEQIRTHPLVITSAPALAQAAASVGCQQTRNRGTLGGNLGNASPAGDSLPALLVQQAVLSLNSRQVERRLALEDFLLGPGITALHPGEIIRQVELEILPKRAGSIFLKLGNRQGMAVSVASVAVCLALDPDGRVAQARIALGAVAPTAIRCSEAEAFLAGQPLTLTRIQEAGRSAAHTCQPIDDLRASAEYRRHAVQTLVKRAISTLAASLPGTE